VKPEDLVQCCPRLYHMAWEGSWPSIQRHGLLSTAALLDLFEIHGDERETLEAVHRPEPVRVSDRVRGTATIRDQKPMSEAGLRRCLEDGLRPTDLVSALLNHRVFFWATAERLEMFLSAKAYRGPASYRARRADPTVPGALCPSGRAVDDEHGLHGAMA